MIRKTLVVSILTICFSLTSWSQDDVVVDTIGRPAWAERVRLRLDTLLMHPMFNTSQLAMVVYDLTADSTLYAYNEQQAMRPASTMKVITAVTALDNLGANHRFRTTMHIDGELRDSVLYGDVIFKGSLDPLFSKADMQSMVSYLRNMGIKRVEGNAVADMSMKDTLQYGEGWCWDDDNPVLSPLLVDGKDKFVDKFKKIWLEDGNAGAGKNVVTHTMTEVLEPMMKDSENLFAEAVFYQLAASVAKGRPATARHARAAIREVVKKIGYRPENYRFADGSGLSLYNYVSAELLTAFLRYAYNNKHIYTPLLSSMPIAGQDGTLKRRMRKTACEGNVRAKTGTLTGLISLAGYCTATNGHKIAFTIINQGVLTNKPARDFQDKVCKVLCEE